MDVADDAMCSHFTCESHLHSHITGRYLLLNLLSGPSVYHFACLGLQVKTMVSLWNLCIASLLMLYILDVRVYQLLALTNHGVLETTFLTIITISMWLFDLIKDATSLIWYFNKGLCCLIFSSFTSLTLVLTLVILISMRSTCSAVVFLIVRLRQWCLKFRQLAAMWHACR